MFNEKQFLVKAIVIMSCDGELKEEKKEFYITLTDEEAQNSHMRKYWIEKTASEEFGAKFQGVKDYEIEEVKEEFK